MKHNFQVHIEHWKDTYDKLRPFQKDAVAFLSEMPKAKSGLNFDDMGLGKTVSTLTAALMHFLRLEKPYRIVIACTLNALAVWQEELHKWFALDAIVYSGSPMQRNKIYNSDILNSSPVIVLTTYNMLEELKEDPWDCIICDEIHMAGLLNHKTKTFKRVKTISRKAQLTYLLTGTPIRQGVTDLFAPLNLIDEKTFPNYWGFVNRHCIVIDGPYGKSIERNPKDVVGFRNLLNKYMLRRLKTEVLKDLPGKQRNIIPLNMTPKQKKAYLEIEEELYYADDDTIIITPNRMTAMLRCRQLLVTPRLLGIDEDGAMLDYLKEISYTYLQTNTPRPFVIFTPFKAAIPFFEDIIYSANENTQIFKISGGLTPAAFANEWQNFQNTISLNKVLIGVIKSGASFHATQASDCFFLGYEWDFNLNVQAEDRLCRLGQKNFVSCNYLFYNGTVDEDMKVNLNSKQDASNWTVGTTQQFQAMLSRFQGRRK